jgi:parvulin-like peptidyl-prolyl isomerase
MESLVPPYDVLVKMVDQLNPGQITEPVANGGHIFILKLEEKVIPSFEPFENVQKKLEAMITYERQKEAINKLNDKIVEQAKLTDLDRFIDFCLSRIYLQSNM